MKLSKRLKRIEQMVTEDYAHIWDCCCDHGFLGAKLLTRQAAKNIHFVDIVPQVMTQLEDKLQQFYSNTPSIWKTHCIDVANLPLDQYKGSHLVIIAGVGGDLMIRFIEGIYQKYPDLTIDFLLCPVHRQFTVRQKLIELNFSLKDECLVEDNQRFYEMILVSTASNESAKVNPVGDKIWKKKTAKETEVVEKYLNQTLNYYQRIQQGNTINVDHVINLYKSVTFN